MINPESSNVIRVKCPSYQIPACSFARQGSYDVDNQCVIIGRPIEDNMSADKIMVIPELIPQNTIGVAFLDGIHVVKKTSGETIVSGDMVGTDENEWTAIKCSDGYFRVISVLDDDYLVIRATGWKDSEEVKLFKVIDGGHVGIYHCREVYVYYSSGGTYFSFVEVATTGYNVFNLAEAGVYGQLSPGDILAAYRSGVSGNKWVGWSVKYAWWHE